MAMPLQEHIAREIRVEMLRQGITQATLAAKLGTDQSIVSRKLTGKSPFTATDLERWAQALDVPVTHFFPRTPERVA